MIIASCCFLISLMGITYLTFRFNALAAIKTFLETLNLQTLDNLILSKTEVNEIVYESRGLTEWKIIDLFWRQYSLLFVAIGISGIIFLLFVTFGVHHVVSKEVKQVLLILQTEKSQNRSQVVNEFQPIFDGLEAAKHEIQKIEEQNEQFRSFASHELRNQLTMLQALFDTYEIEQPAILLQHTSLKETVENLLMMSYLPSDIKLQEVDLVLSVATVIDEFSKKMEITWKYGEDCLETKVLGTENLLHRCLYNILDNAYRYRKKNTNVEVEVHRYESVLTLRITNESEKENFVDIEGHGIGLQLVEHVIGIMQGYYYVEFVNHKVITYLSFPLI